MKARDIMSANVISVGLDTKVRDAINLMLEHKISGLPVVDGDGVLVGLLTENDLVLGSRSGLPLHLQVLEDMLGAKDPGRHLRQMQELGSRPVNSLMVRDVVTATPNTPVGELVALLVQNDFKRIPIIEGKMLVGIVTRADIIKIMK